MPPSWSSYLAYFISGCLVAIVAMGTAYLASDGSEKAWTIALVGGLIAFAKDVQAHAKFPPE